MSYRLIDDYSNTRDIKAQDLKHYINNGDIAVRNLTLTSDNRLVDKQLEMTPRDFRDIVYMGKYDYGSLDTMEKPCKYKNTIDDVYQKVIKNTF